MQPLQQICMQPTIKPLWINCCQQLWMNVAIFAARCRSSSIDLIYNKKLNFTKHETLVKWSKKSDTTQRAAQCCSAAELVEPGGLKPSKSQLQATAATDKETGHESRRQKIFRSRLQIFFIIQIMWLTEDTQELEATSSGKLSEHICSLTDWLHCTTSTDKIMFYTKKISHGTFSGI